MGDMSDQVNRLTAAELAVRLRISVRQVQRLDAAGMPSIPTGPRRKVYDPLACEAWLSVVYTSTAPGFHQNFTRPAGLLPACEHSTGAKPPAAPARSPLTPQALPHLGPLFGPPLQVGARG